MAKEGLFQVRHSYPASADLSANANFIFANLDGSDELQVAGAGELAFVLRNTKDVQAQGEFGDVVLIGKTKVVCGGTIDALNPVTPDASGHAVAATAASVDTTTSTAAQDVAGDQACGIALEDGVDGDLITVLVVAGGLT